MFQTTCSEGARQQETSSMSFSYEEHESNSSQECRTFESDEATCGGEPVLPLKEEIRLGDLSAVRQAVINPNARDDDFTLLHWAVSYTDIGNLQEEGLETENMSERRIIVCELLERGANVNALWLQDDASDESPMTPIDMTKDEEMLEILREASVRQALDVDESALLVDRDDHLRIGLISAAALGRSKDCATLCHLGADVNDNSLGTTALGIAAAFGHLDTVEKLLKDLGANVNTVLKVDGEQTALYVAVYEGHEEIVKLLLKHGANPLQQALSYGGMSKWACAGSLDGGDGKSEKQEVDMALRGRIIELVLSASLDKVKEQVFDKARHYEIDWRDYSWIFLEFVRHGYLSGMDHLLLCPNFDFPPSCLQLAVAVGDHEALLYLLRAGALSSYNEEDEEERYYGPGFARPGDASIQQCRETLNEWLAENEVNQKKLKEQCTVRDLR